MLYQKMNESILAQIIEIVGESQVFTDEETIADYAHDETEDLHFPPEVVVKPLHTKQVSELLRFCNQNQIPVTPRGAGTGLSGGCLPVKGGVSLSMERMNKIIDLDIHNLQITVEPGVITEEIINAAAKHDLLYPVDPASKGSCFIGGNVAHGSGGPRVVKYGTIRDYVLNLEIVLASGEVIWTAANTLKFASGYNLTQLMIGSEGTLGVITKIVLKLIPKPKFEVLMLASFSSNEAACAAVSAIFKEGIWPSAMEYMERKGVEWVKKYEHISYPLQDEEEAFLLIELSGNSMELLHSDAEAVYAVLESKECVEVLMADTAQQKDDLWRLRIAMGHSVKSNSIYKEEDTVVPRAALPELIKGIKAVGEKYGFESVCYGHAGDGNLHVNIIKGNMSDDAWHHDLQKGIEEIFKLTVDLGGTISGEHGIGWVQKNFMPIKFPELHFQLMRGIKQVFDPNGILNPAKIFPDIQMRSKNED